MKIRIENNYSDGHVSEHVVDVLTEPRPEMLEEGYDYGATGLDENWWEVTVAELLGDGHGDGTHGKLGYCYTATIVEADDPDLVGRSYEWAGF